MAKKTPEELVEEKRAERLRLERRISYLLDSYVDLDDDGPAELEREERLLEEARERHDALVATLPRRTREDYDRRAVEVDEEGDGDAAVFRLENLRDELAELKQRADRFFEKFKEELGIVTIKDAHNLWELERLARELEDQIDGIEA